MENSELVSVIITTYRRPRYLKETLESVMGQTYRNIEVIVVDDGTPGDENYLICRQWPAIRYLKISNTGSPIVPRNVGFKQSKGLFVAFLDDDDIWMPEKIMTQVQILKQNPDFGLVHGSCYVIDGEGESTGEVVGRLKNRSEKHGQVFDRMVGRFTVMMPTPLIRREWVELVGGFNENIPAAGEDMEFFCHLAFYTPFFYLDQPLAFYRIHGSGISVKNPFYVSLPLVLFRLVKKLRRHGLSIHRFRIIRKQLLVWQIEKIHDFGSLGTVLANCLLMSPCFFMNPVLGLSMVKKIIMVVLNRISNNCTERGRVETRMAV